MDLASFRGRSTLTLTFPYQTVVEIESISTNPVLSTKFVHGFAERGRVSERVGNVTTDLWCSFLKYVKTRTDLRSTTD
jgi:hypothetical protein